MVELETFSGSQSLDLSFLITEFEVVVVQMILLANKS